METNKQTNKQSTKQSTTEKRHLDKRKVINSIMIVFLSLVLIGGVGIFFILNDVLNNSPEYNVKNLNAAEPSRVYSSDDSLVGELGAESRENITYDQLPQSIIDAFLSIEDSRFFSHNGFDLPRFMKSALVNLSSGSFAQGGSTLTMQMIDNSFFTECNEDGTTPGAATTCLPKTGNPIEKVKRKVQEIFMSMQAENEFDKADIFTKYVNKINFGDNARGIQKGAQYYFGKSVEDITLSEAAFLAGVINLPNTYNPYLGTTFDKETGEVTANYYEYATERRDSTLYQMLNHGYITKEEYNLATSTELAFQLNGKTSFDSDAYHDYLDQVYTEVREMTGQDPALIQMDIYTAMDKGAQELSYDILQGDGGVSFPDDYFDTGFAVVDSTNGEIKALGGGRPLEGVTELTWKNQATNNDLGHQPGSSIKPIIDYALAFEYAGWSTTEQLNDTGSISVFGGTHTIYNSTREKHGWVSLEKAIAESYNTTAVMAFNEVFAKIGEEGYLDYMHKMGYKQLDTIDANAAIGGGSYFFTSPLQMAGAYTVLANAGVYNEPHAVTKVVIRETGEVFETKVEGEQAMSEQAAYLTSTVLGGAVRNSRSYFTLLPSIIKSYPTYGKTGTSDWGDSGLSIGVPETAMKDLWLVGYTSKYSIATWCGYNATADMPIKYPSDPVMTANYSGQITSILLDYMHQNEAPAAITRPNNGISSITHLLRRHPVTAAPSNTSSSWVTTGEIKSEFAGNLGSVSVDSLSSLSSFTSSLKTGTTNTLQMNWAAYPDASKLSDPDQNSEISDTLLYGKVVYKADIKYNGSVIKTVTTSSNTIEDTFSGVPEGSTIQVCGYYAYSNADTKSAEVCSSVTIPKKETTPTVPDNTTPTIPDTTKPDATKPEDKKQ